MAGATIYEELGEFKANAAGATGDEVCGVRTHVERGWLSDDDFADVFGVSHVGEGGRSIFKGKDGDGERMDGAVGE